jgi:soluble lytic murein transglycosylase-like protein
MIATYGSIRYVMRNSGGRFLMRRGMRAEKRKRNQPRRNLLKLIIFLVGTLAGGVAVPSMLLADIYKYVDKDGVIHFSNVPSTEGKWILVIKEKRVHFNLGRNYEKYDPEIWKASQRYSVDYNLVKAVIKAESNFNPRAVSRAGARGLMQLMPQTANLLQVNDSFHPEENIDGGVRYLRYLLNLYNENLQLALAAYNAGEKAVFKYRGIPPYQETQTYVQRVLRYYQDFRRESRSPVHPSHSEN